MNTHFLYKSNSIRWLITSALVVGACCSMLLQPPLVHSQSGDRQPGDRQVINPSATILEFRLQKPGTQKQLRQTLQRYSALKETAKQLARSGSPAARRKNQQAIAQTEQALKNLYGPVVLDATDVDRVGFETSSGPPQIFLQFKPDGSQKFAQLTRQAAGTERALGIFANGRWLSGPTVPVEYAKTGITGGRAVISGSFSLEQAQELVNQLAGKP